MNVHFGLTKIKLTDTLFTDAPKNLEQQVRAKLEESLGPLWTERSGSKDEYYSRIAARGDVLRDVANISRVKPWYSLVKRTTILVDEASINRLKPGSAQQIIENLKDYLKSLDLPV